MCTPPRTSCTFRRGLLQRTLQHAVCIEEHLCSGQLWWEVHAVNPYTPAVTEAGISICQGCSFSHFIIGLAWYEPWAFVARLQGILQTNALLFCLAFLNNRQISGNFIWRVCHES